MKPDISKLMHSVTHPLTRQSSAMLLLRVASFGIAFLYGILLARVLGAAGMGILTLARTAASFTGTVGRVGFNNLLLRQTAVYRARGNLAALRGLIRRGDQITLGVSLLACLTAFGLAWIIAEEQRSLFLTVLAIVLAGVPIWNLATLRQAVIRGGMRAVTGHLPELITQPALACSAFAAWFFFFPHIHTPIAAAMIVLGTQTAGLVHASILRGEAVSPAVKPIYQTREWVAASLPMMSLGGLMLTNQLVDQFIIAGWCPHAEIGRYSVAARVASVVAFFPMAAGASLTPRFAAMYAEGKRKVLQRLLTVSTRIVFVASLLFALILIGARQPILSLFGPEFVSASGVLVLLSLGFVLHAGFGPVGVLLVMAGQERISLVWMIIASVLNVILDLALIPRFGIVGAAAATVATAAMSRTILTIVARKRLGLASHVFGFHGANLDGPEPTEGGDTPSGDMASSRERTVED